MPDNYDVYVTCFNLLVKQLKQKPEGLQNYDSIIKDQLKNNIMEPVDLLESCEVGQAHYLPHHCVMREETSSTKLRIRGGSSPVMRLLHKKIVGMEFTAGGLGAL